MSKQHALLLALFGASFLVGGCARPGEKKAEKAIVELLPSYLGPADSYKSTVKAASLGALMRGRVRTVHIEGTNVRLRPDLVVAALTVDAKEVEIDKNAHTLQNVGEARFVARIEEAPLDRFVRGFRPKLADLRVSLRGPFVQVRLTPEVFGYPTVPITIDGNLLARGGGVALDFEPDRARLLVVPIPKPVLDVVAEQLNPVVDFTSVNAPIRVERAEVRGGSLYLSGSIPPEDVVRLTQPKR